MAAKTDRLRRAAERGDLETVKALLRDGANVNEQDRDGGTALLAALSSLNFFKTVVHKGRTISVRAISLADIKQLVSALLQAGADPNLAHEQFGTPLMSASHGGS